MYSRVLFAIATLSGVQAIKGDDMRTGQRVGKRLDDTAEAVGNTAIAFGNTLGGLWESGKNIAVNAGKAVGGAVKAAGNAAVNVAVGAGNAVAYVAKGISSAADEGLYGTNYQTNRISLPVMKPKDMVYTLERRRDSARYFLKFLKEAEHASENDIDVQIAELEIVNSDAMIDLIDEVEDGDIAARDASAANRYARYQDYKIINGVKDSVSAVTNYVSTKAGRAKRWATTSAKKAKNAVKKSARDALKAYAENVSNFADDTFAADAESEFDQYDESE